LRGVASGRTASRGKLIERLAVESLIEGCIEEGVAAEVARVGAHYAKDPAIAKVLGRIAREESSHAELAYAVVGWAARQQPSVMASLEPALERSRRRRRPLNGSVSLLEFGRLDRAYVDRLANRVYGTVRNYVGKLLPLRLNPSMSAPSHRGAVGQLATSRGPLPWMLLFLAVAACSRRSAGAGTARDAGHPSMLPASTESGFLTTPGGMNLDGPVAPPTARVSMEPKTGDAPDAAGWASLCGEEDRPKDTPESGSCGSSCRGRCSLGRCVVQLAQAGNRVTESWLAADAAHIYWSNNDWREDDAPRTFWRVPKEGGKATPLAQGQAKPPAPAFKDGPNSYSVKYMDGGLSAVVKRPISGGSATAVTVGAPYVDIIEVDATSIYWVAYPAGPAPGSWQTPKGAWTAPGAGTVKVMSAPTQGGAITTLATWPSCFHRNGVADGESVYFSTGSCGESVDTDYEGYGEIVKVPLHGGVGARLASVATPVSIVVDETSVYWTDCRGGERRKPLGLLSWRAGRGVRERAVATGPIPL
jgi:hypothetical protein